MLQLFSSQIELPLLSKRRAWKDKVNNRHEVSLGSDGSKSFMRLQLSSPNAKVLLAQRLGKMKEENSVDMQEHI